jgi:hypothetical protein
MRLVIVSILFYFMLVHIRLISVFALVTPFMVASSLIDQFPYLSSHSQRKEQPVLVDELLQRSRPYYGLILLFLIVGQALFAIYVRGISPRQSITPTAAVNHILHIDPTGRVYNDFSFNGYLIFRGVKTFIDGRTDQLFGGGFLTRVFESPYRPDDEFLALLDEYKTSSALVVPGSAQARKLEESLSWVRRYEDDIAVVYQRVLARP